MPRLSINSSVDIDFFDTDINVSFTASKAVPAFGMNPPELAECSIETVYIDELDVTEMFTHIFVPDGTVGGFQPALDNLEDRIIAMLEEGQFDDEPE